MLVVYMMIVLSSRSVMNLYVSLISKISAYLGLMSSESMHVRVEILVCFLRILGPILNNEF